MKKQVNYQYFSEEMYALISSLDYAISDYFRIKRIAEDTEGVDEWEASVDATNAEKRIKSITNAIISKADELVSREDGEIAINENYRLTIKELGDSLGNYSYVLSHMDAQVEDEGKMQSVKKWINEYTYKMVMLIRFNISATL